MPQQEKRSKIGSAFLLIRRVFVLAVITAVGAFAFFEESLPEPVKNIVTSFTGKDYSEKNDDMLPHRFRVEKNSDVQANFPPQLSQSTQTPVTYSQNVQETNFPAENAEYRPEIDNAAITALHDELIQLGAISCQLSFWGDDGKMYRFTCRMPVSEQNSDATRMFQTIAPDAPQAMREVIGQVRQWQSGG